MMHEQNSSYLASEAEFFYSVFFSDTPDQNLLDRYVAVHETCFPVISPEYAALTAKIVLLKLDVEAIEYVIRLKQRDNILTKKLQILFFLVEVRSQYFEYFYNVKNNRARAIISLILFTVESTFKYVKGRYLILKYDLI